ncbi:MAG: hypothetical protein WCK77_25745 [Verrucomicrobiota bacterium]
MNHSLWHIAKRLLVSQILGFSVIFILLIVLNILDVLRIGETPLRHGIVLAATAVGIAFLLATLLLWGLSCIIVAKQWNSSDPAKNWVSVAALLFGNILGAYLVLFWYSREIRAHLI